MSDIFYDIYYFFVIDFSQGLISTYLLYEVLRPKREGKFLRASTIIISFTTPIIVVVLAYFDINATIIEIIMMIIPKLIYAKICLKGSIIKRTILSIISALLFMPTSLISLYFTTIILDIPIRLTIEHGPFQFMMYHIITFIHFLVYTLVTKLLVKKKFNITLKKPESIAMLFSFSILCVILGLIMTIYKDYSDTLNINIQTLLGIITVAVIFLNVALYYFIFKITKQNRIEQENELLRMEQKYEQKHVEDIHHQYEQMQQIRHDYKNNFMVIRSLIADKNNSKAIELINKNLDKINTQKSYIKTNNEVVNAIVNIKISEAASYGIKTKFMSISDFDGLNDYDLCTLISNVLDNAIRAVAYTDIEDKTISITFTKRGKYYTLETVNPIEKSVLNENPDLTSTKSDRASHGYGTKIIKDIANKYNGSIDYFEKDKNFHFLVHMYDNN